MPLEPGDTAPDFTLPDQSGEPVALASFKGRKVLVYFYPKADTPGCTQQSCNLRDAFPQLKKLKSAVVGVSPDPADNERMIEWARSYWSDLHPHSAGGAYVNMMMEEGDDRVRASYGDHYDRLRQIKATYDPDNLFRVNQNITPKLARSLDPAAAG